jgi:hypothetical protein
VAETESASKLREQFESQLKAYREVTATAVAMNFPHVKAEDLMDTDPAELIEKAKTVSATRTEERERIFEEMARERGINIGENTQSTSAQGPMSDAASRIASLGSLNGAPLAQPQPGEGRHGRDRLEAVLQARADAAKRRTLA